MLMIKFLPAYLRGLVLKACGRICPNKTRNVVYNIIRVMTVWLDTHRSCVMSASVKELFTIRKCPRNNVGTSLAKQSIVFEKSNYESAFVSPSPPLCCWRLVFTKPASAVGCCRTGVLNCENQEIVVPCMSHNLIYPYNLT